MLKNIRNSAVKYFAVFAALALVGAGTAAAAKLITGKQIKDGTVTSKDIRKGSLNADRLSQAARTALTGQPGQPGEKGPKGDTGPAGTPDGYTKAEADATFLGKTAKAADADTLDGANGDDYVRGDARITYNSALGKAIPSPDFKLIDVGDVAEITAGCNPGASKALSLRNISSDELTYTRSFVGDESGPTIATETIAPGASKAIASAVGNYQFTLQVLRPGANALASADFSTVTITATDSGTCTFMAQAVDSERDATNPVINP